MSAPGCVLAPSTGLSRAPFPIPPDWNRQHPSPNANARPAGVPVSAIVLHADADARVETTLDYMSRRASAVSYHVVIARTGLVFLLVPPERRAWHAGVSALAGVGNVNDFSVGVCLANRNDGVEPYTERQLAAAATVVRALMAHFGVPASRVVRHRDVALPPGRKTDPAPPAFDVAAFRGRLA